jgi:hypothetical protein
MRGTPGPQIREWGSVEDLSEDHASWSKLDQRVDRVLEMLRRSATVKAAVALRTDPIVNATPVIEPPEDPTPDEEEAAEWFNEVLIRDAWTPFDSVLRWLMTAPSFGFSVIEGHFARRDLMRTPVKWEFRSQYSISRAWKPWLHDGRDLVGINQDLNAVIGDITPTTMDVRNVLHGIYHDNGSPEGQSFLRSVAAAEWVLDRALHYWMIAVMRWGSPTPVGTIDANTDTFSTDVESIIANTLTALEDVRTHQKGAVVLYPGIKVDTLGVGDGERVKAEEVIKFGLEEIARGLSVPFLILGQAGNTGAYALADTFFDGYLNVIEADAKWAEAAIQRCVIDPLGVANWGVELRSPQVKLKDVRRQAASAVIAAYQAARSAGLPAAKGDEGWLRDMLRAPPPDPVEVQGPAPPAPPEKKPPPEPTPNPEGDADEDGVVEDEAAEMAADVGALPFWRELRPHERVVAFRAIGGAMDDAVDAITRTTAALRERIAADLLGQVDEAVRAAAESDTAAQLAARIRAIKTPRAMRAELVAAILEHLVEVDRQGRESQRRELRRAEAAKRTGLNVAGLAVDADAAVAMLNALADAQLVAENAPPHDPENARALQRVRAEQLADQTVGELEEGAKSGALRMLDTGETLGTVSTAVKGLVAARLLERSARRIASAVGGMVPRGFNSGRRREIKRRMDQGAQFRVFHSALLDSGTCAPCIDAERYTESNVVLADSREALELAPPLEPNGVSFGAAGEGCRGGLATGANRCRCIHVAVAAEAGEVAA